jgi:CrcB protein
MDRYLLVMLGGAAGSALRYGISLAIMNRWQPWFPIATVVVNVTGCFLIGVVLTLLAERHLIDPRLGLLLATGFLGGYTTFSSFAYETDTLAREGHPFPALANILLSVVLGWLAVRAGVLTASFLKSSLH